MTDRRLIEDWLPIAALGEESVRERRSMTALPPTYYLHVWWARRPLVASRAAVLASLLPAHADHKRFLHILGIHGDPVAAKKRIAAADRRGERLGADAYGYSRAFTYTPDDEDRVWLAERIDVHATTVLDPTAGGGSIPFETLRLGINATANDLNPVATLILEATVDWPMRYGWDVLHEFKRIGEEFCRRVRERLAWAYPDEGGPDLRPDGYLWARTIRCPYCEGLVPLSPNWRLAPDGTGVRLVPDIAKGPGSEGRVCRFEIVTSLKQQSTGTVSGGDGLCPFSDCNRVIDGDVIKAEAQAGRMGEQLYAVVFKRRVLVKTKTGRTREKWERGYRAPRPEDDVSDLVAARLAEKLPEWEALDIVPSEKLPLETESWSHGNTPAQYGETKFRGLFSPRQLLGHGTSVEVFRELLDDMQLKGTGESAKAGSWTTPSDSMLSQRGGLMPRWPRSSSALATIGPSDRRRSASRS